MKEWAKLLDILNSCYANVIKDNPALILLAGRFDERN
jgi:hypothetical protein